jgi:23S rRNA pseudouridine1911/1915/1917 synthase
MQYTASASDAGKRVDILVTEVIPRLSRAFATKLCDQDLVILKDRPAKAGSKVREGDQLVINYDLAELDKIPEIQLPIIYEDEDCVVIDKPAGVLTHSKGAFNPEATVATFLRQHSSAISGERAGIVHRLDRATSGVIIGAKNPEALSWLQKQFAQRRTKKTYMAIISGTLTPEHAVIDMPIERNPRKPQTFRVGPGGKLSQTEYKVLKGKGEFSLVELMPQTGRTHQLRVHLAYQKHPIVGDVLYGGAPADRLYLHALSLELTLPNRERKVFTSALPASFEAFLDVQ